MSEPVSETKRLEAPKRPTDAVGGQHIGGVLAYNENPYPVEVTVRRVAEPITLRRYVVYDDEGWFLSKELQGAGFLQGQQVEMVIRQVE